jgi:hypothetical protein
MNSSNGNTNTLTTEKVLVADNSGFIKLEDWARSKGITFTDALFVCRKQKIKKRRIKQTIFAVKADLELAFAQEINNQDKIIERKTDTIKKTNLKKREAVQFIKAIILCKEENALVEPVLDLIYENKELFK